MLGRHRQTLDTMVSLRPQRQQDFRYGRRIEIIGTTRKNHAGKHLPIILDKSEPPSLRKRKHPFLRRDKTMLERHTQTLDSIEAECQVTLDGAAKSLPRDEQRALPEARDVPMTEPSPEATGKPKRKMPYKFTKQGREEAAERQRVADQALIDAMRGTWYVD